MGQYIPIINIYPTKSTRTSPRPHFLFVFFYAVACFDRKQLLKALDGVILVLFFMHFYAIYCKK